MHLLLLPRVLVENQATGVSRQYDRKSEDESAASVQIKIKESANNGVQKIDEKNKEPISYDDKTIRDTKELHGQMIIEGEGWKVISRLVDRLFMIFYFLFLLTGAAHYCYKAFIHI